MLILDQLLNELVTSNKVLDGIIADIDALDEQHERRIERERQSLKVTMRRRMPAVILGQGCYIKTLCDERTVPMEKK